MRNVAARSSANRSHNDCCEAEAGAAGYTGDLEGIPRFQHLMHRLYDIEYVLL